jgi:hypothetical protein
VIAERAHPRHGGRTGQVLIATAPSRRSTSSCDAGAGRQPDRSRSHVLRSFRSPPAWPKILGVLMREDGPTSTAWVARPTIARAVHTIPNSTTPPASRPASPPRGVDRLCRRHRRRWSRTVEEEMRLLAWRHLPIKSMDSGQVVIYAGTFSKSSSRRAHWLVIVMMHPPADCHQAVQRPLLVSKGRAALLFCRRVTTRPCAGYKLFRRHGGDSASAAAPPASGPGGVDRAGRRLPGLGAVPAPGGVDNRLFDCVPSARLCRRAATISRPTADPSGLLRCWTRRQSTRIARLGRAVRSLE